MYSGLKVEMEFAEVNIRVSIVAYKRGSFMTQLNCAVHGKLSSNAVESKNTARRGQQLQTTGQVDNELLGS